MKKITTHQKSAAPYHANMLIVLTAMALLLLVSAGTWAQIPAPEQNSSVPSAEEFTPTDGILELVAPGKNRNRYSDTVRIYNEDGSLWYEFSLDNNHPLYYEKTPKPEYQPFAPLEIYIAAIRLKAISPNWYEVLVDEKNQKTKYIAISAPFHKRETFQHLIGQSGTVTFDQEKNPLRETPDGKVKSFSLLESDRFLPIKFEGEWLKVWITAQRLQSLPAEYGWIRWKRDREILIGFMLNCKECF